MAQKISPQWNQFRDRYGAQWRVRWNEATQTPSHILGYKLATRLSEKSSDQEVEAWSRNFLDANQALLGVGSWDLDLLSLSHANRGRQVTFSQVNDGLTVYGALLKLSVNLAQCIKQPMGLT